jgi:AcrR family transcriptional regulator
MNKQDAQEQEMILGALNLFDKYGIRSVTMDDVAREMSVSKKTLYKYFENKADLVHKCIMTIFDQVQACMLEIHATAQNAIDELFDIDNVIRQILADHNPGLQFQLHKYYPQTAKALYDGRKRLINKMISENIDNGKKDGLFRKDFDTQIVTHLYCSKVETLPEEQEELMMKFHTKDVMLQALEYHIRGMASKKGLAYLEKKLKETE